LWGKVKGHSNNNARAAPRRWTPGLAERGCPLFADAFHCGASSPLRHSQRSTTSSVLRTQTFDALVGVATIVLREKQSWPRRHQRRRSLLESDTWGHAGPPARPRRRRPRRPRPLDTYAGSRRSLRPGPVFALGWRAKAGDRRLDARPCSSTCPGWVRPTARWLASGADGRGETRLSRRGRRSHTSCMVRSVRAGRPATAEWSW
jgi:hypothetical protein